MKKAEKKTSCALLEKSTDHSEAREDQNKGSSDEEGDDNEDEAVTCVEVLKRSTLCFD
jgi:hypothetical protein